MTLCLICIKLLIVNGILKQCYLKYSVIFMWSSSPAVQSLCLCVRTLHVKSTSAGSFYPVYLHVLLKSWVSNWRRTA